MTPKEALEIILWLSLWDYYNDEPHEWNKKETEAYELMKQSIAELERLQAFKNKFDNYELANKQDFIAYENWQECERELAELKRDVSRYFKLWEQAREKWGNGLDDKEAYEHVKLHLKLSKVGKEE